MPLPIPEPGLVISYVYLWSNEHKSGRDEGVKSRPCVIVIAVRQEGGEQVVTVAPVTHSPPYKPEDAVEIPSATKQRLGLDAARSWVVITEVNEFSWPGPDIRPVAQGRFEFGVLPPALFRQIRDRMTRGAGTAGLKSVPRIE